MRFHYKPVVRRSLIPVQFRTIVTPVPLTEAKSARSASSRKISTKLLCDVSGTRYYESNEEIDMGPNHAISVFDENNVNIGQMSFAEGFALAVSLGKDIVLRNRATDPPVMKIMDYKVELVKRVFKKLGKELKGDGKPKTIQMSSDISMHDLEFRKRRAIEFLKQGSKLKMFMRVNVYDPENIQKGRLILLNVAEDLKEHAKIKVHPGGAKATQKAKQQAETNITKHMSANEMEEQAEQQSFVKMNRALINADEGDDWEEEDDAKQYIYMELESTQSGLADVDIEAMFNSSSVEDFMHGISKRGTFATEKKAEPKKKTTEDAFDMIQEIMSGGPSSLDTPKAEAPVLDFNADMKEAAAMNESDDLRNRAMQNLRERRMRLKSSAIFNAKASALKTFEAKVEAERKEFGIASDDSDKEEEQAAMAAMGREIVDLTVEQAKVEDDEGMEEMDDFDLLDATLDPTDVKSMDRRQELELEIEYESIKIKCKMAWKIAMSEENPLKVDE